MQLLEHSEKEHRDFQLLNPEGFKEKLLEDIRSAKTYIVIKSFLWRNDLFGNEIASAVLEAANRGVQIFIIKDKLGALYEYGEPPGQSLFHENKSDHLVHYFYGKILSFLYDLKVEDDARNSLGNSLLNPHSGLPIKVIRANLHDHSKAVLIDKKIAYVTGVNFGYEHLEKAGVWNDFALRIEDPKEYLNLLTMLAGINQEGIKQEGSHSVEFHYGVGKVLKKRLKRFILETREKLSICMAYLGDPVITDALINILQCNKKLTLIVPTQPSINRGNNLRTLQRLVSAEGVNPGLLEIILSSELDHGKCLGRDDQIVWIGSSNMTRSDHLVDTVAMVEDPRIVKTFDQAIHEIKANADDMLTGARLVQRLGQVSAVNKVLCRLEDIGVSFTEATHLLEIEEIQRARMAAQKVIQGVLTTFHS